ncbi:ribonuclease H-like domain-containing protein [Bisporella sp. PMI_857]|nr:ribonuclease H-like domain-containing protein [Bisporella sp. PMI_857]
MAGTTRKRKLDDDGVKYYAVKAGHTPGVFTAWKLCQQSITGFKGAQFKSFLSEKDAMDFVAGRVVKGPSAKPKEPRFYGVAVGRVPGVYEEWAEAEQQVVGVQGPKYKKFPTRAEAEAFVADNRKDGVRQSGPPSKRAKTGAESATKANKFVAGKETKVYTDGSALGNGRVGAVAGVGVYFGPNDQRNVSEPLQGIPQTNQRAELTAVLRALEIVSRTENIRIFTDSNYSISCSSLWYKNWQKNGWRNSKGEDVMNRDLIESIRELIDSRDRNGAKTNFEWVKGHSNDPSNEAADRLAVAGARTERYYF